MNNLDYNGNCVSIGAHFKPTSTWSIVFEGVLPRVIVVDNLSSHPSRPIWKKIIEIIYTTMHFIGRVTILFANNSLMECLITMKFLHIFFTP